MLPRLVGGISPDAKLMPISSDEQGSLTPEQWTADHQKLVLRFWTTFTDNIEGSGTSRLIYYLIKSDGSTKQQLITEITDSASNEGLDFDISERAGIWSKSTVDSLGDIHMYVSKRRDNMLGGRKVDIFQGNTPFPDYVDLEVFFPAETFPIAPGDQEITHSDHVPSPDGSKLYFRRPGFTTSGYEAHHWLCNADASGLYEIALGLDPLEYFILLRWSADSVKLYAEIDGANYIVYDVVAETVNTYSIVQEDALSNVFMSPDHSKIVWTETTFADGGASGERWLFIGNPDGSGATLLYHTPPYVDPINPVEDEDQTILMLSGPIAWSFDGTKIAVVDRRPQSPIWIFDIATGVGTKVYDGDGWGINPTPPPSEGGDDGGGATPIWDGKTPWPPQILNLMMFNA